jgi:hypothetical protein
MSDPPQLFYRLLPNGVGWYWEIIDAENGISRARHCERAKSRAPLRLKPHSID